LIKLVWLNIGLLFIMFFALLKELVIFSQRIQNNMIGNANKNSTRAIKNKKDNKCSQKVREYVILRLSFFNLMIVSWEILSYLVVLIVQSFQVSKTWLRGTLTKFSEISIFLIKK
jgi:hypothetical protein